MRKFCGIAILTLLFNLVFVSSRGQTTIAFNGAESTGTTWTTSSNGFTASTTNTGTPAERIKSGTQSWQKSNGTATLVTNAASTSGYSSCFVEIWNASISVTTGNGIDAGDSLKVYVSNTTTFGTTPDITVTTDQSNVRWGMSGTGVVTTTAGTAVTQSYGTGGTRTGANAFSKLVINIPSGWTSVYLKIESKNNDANEIWCVDDIALKGTSCTNPGTPNCTTPADVCAGYATTITGTGSSPSATSYTFWDASTGGNKITSGVSGNVLTTPTNLTPGTYHYYVQGENSSSCVSASRQDVVVTVIATPSTPSNPSTSTNPACTSTSLQTMTVPGGETYYWQGTNSAGTSTGGSLNAATNSYNINTVGTNTYYVRAINNTTGCWSVNSGSLSVTIFNSTPSAPVFTSATTTNNNLTPCIGATGNTYSVNSTAGVSYAWSIPSGGSPAWVNSGLTGATISGITIGSTSGSVTVTPSNACGTGTANSITINPITIPGAPGSISGSMAPCINSTGNAYNISAVAGATGYTWTLPSGWTQTGGTTTNAITVTAGTTSGNITVTPYNNCGNSLTTATLSVTPTPVPAVPDTLSASDIYDNGFTANWQSATSATSYKIDVYRIAVNEDFTDGNATANPVWSGDVSSFGVLTASTLPSGTASTDGSYFGSNASVNNAIATTPSTENSVWQFSLGSATKSYSSSNYFGVILMSNNAVTGSIASASFNGYYIRIGVDGSSDKVELWKSAGSTKTKVGDFPSSPTLDAAGAAAGLNIRITRNSSGVFELFYSTGFDYATTPATSMGTLTDNTYTSSSYFGVFCNFANAATDRRVYIDNIVIGMEYVSGYQNLSVSNTQVDVSGLTVNTQYYYVVRGVNACFESANSFAVGAYTVSPCTPTIVIDTLYPGTGSAGTLVTIKGSAFTGATVVKFGSTAATSFTVVSDTVIIAEVPSSAPSDKIYVTNSTGCNSSSDQIFQYLSQSGTCGGTSGTASDLFISEIYDAEDGSLSYIEIFNGTASSISLSNYSIRIQTTTSNFIDLSLGSGSIASGAVKVVQVGSSAIVCGITPDFDYSTSAGFNGNDRVYLRKNGSTLDYVPNPNYGGSASPGFNQIRKSTVTAPNSSYNSAEWTITTTESCSDIGVAPYSLTGPTISITSHPSDVNCTTLTLSVGATSSGSGTLTYVWKYNNPQAMGDWVNVSALNVAPITVSGSSTSTLTINGPIAELVNYQFYCELQRGSCVFSSNAAQYTYTSYPQYRSVKTANGNWSEKTNWETHNGSTWVAACTYPTSSNSSTVNIQDGSKIILDFDNDIDNLNIEYNGTLEISLNSKLLIHDSLKTTPFYDLKVDGTLIDRATSSGGNGLYFDNPSGTANDASWVLGTAGTIVKTQTSSVNNYKDFYQGGISSMPDGSGGAKWIYRYNGDGDPNTTSVGMYYPNLYFENTANTGTWNWNSGNMPFTGSGGFATVYGNMYVGTTGTGSVGVYNQNTNAQPMLISGSLYIGAIGTTGSTLSNAGATIGTGFEVKKDIVIASNAALVANGGASSGLLSLTGSTAQSISGAGSIALQNVTVNHTGSGVTLSKDITIPGTLTITNGLLNAQTQTLNGAGNLTMTGGSLQLSKNGVTLPELTGTYTLNGGTVIFNGNGTGGNAQTVRAVNYYNLTSTSTGDRILPSSGTVGVAAAFTPNYPAQSYTITGSTVDFNGSAAAQNIPSFTFYNVGVKNGGTKTLAATDTVINELTLGGNPSSSDGTVLALSNYDVVLRSTSALTAKVNKTALPLANVTYGTGRFVVERYLPMQTPYSGRRWRLMGVPVSTTNAPTIREAWQENATPTPTTTSATATTSIYNPNPGYGTHITNGIGSVNNANGFDAGSTSSPSIYKLEPGSSTWAAPTSTNQLITNYNAYMLFVRGDRSIVVSNQYINTTGGTNIRTRGKINIGQFQKTIYPGFNAISNPYASPVNMRNVNYDGTGSLNTYYLWDPKLLGSYSVGGWATFSWDGLTEYDFTPYSGNATGMSSYSGNGIVESGMAFMINKTTASNTTVEFTESSKTIASNNTTGIASRPSGDKPMKFYTNLLYKSSANEVLLADGVMTSFGGGATNDFDEMDVEKLQTFLTKERIGQLRNGNLFSIERRSDVTMADTVFLQMLKLTNNYNYRLQFITKNVNTTLVPFLVDHYLNKTTLVKVDSAFDYDFVTNADAASVATDRFTVVFKQREGSIVLPVNFINVSAVKQSPTINKLSWQLGNEINVTRYSIERSFNGVDFSLVGTEKVNHTNAYQWLDNLTASVVYYRIAAVDANGSVQYSRIVKLSGNNTNASVTLVQNPVSAHAPLFVQLNNMPFSKYAYILANALGQQMHKGEFTSGGNNAIVELNTPVTKGVYYLTITSENNLKYSLKVVVE